MRISWIMLFRVKAAGGICLVGMKSAIWVKHKCASRRPAHLRTLMEWAIASACSA